MTPERYLMIGLLLTGCNAAGLPLNGDGGTPFSPQKVVSGVYRVTVHTNADDCAPPKATGELGRQALFADSQRLAVFVPEANGPLTSWQQFDLSARDGYARQLTIEPPCSLPPSSVSSAWTVDLQVLAADDHEVQLSDIEDVHAPQACTLWSTCHSDRLMTFTLVQACPDPIIPNGTVQCP